MAAQDRLFTWLLVLCGSKLTIGLLSTLLQYSFTNVDMASASLLKMYGVLSRLRARMAS
jgi:hypothetical protein